MLNIPLLTLKSGAMIPDLQYNGTKEQLFALLKIDKFLYFTAEYFDEETEVTYLDDIYVDPKEVAAIAFEKEILEKKPKKTGQKIVDMFPKRDK